MSAAAGPKTIVNPYIGPRPFQRNDRAFFFGRDLEAPQLLSLVLSERIVLFYAQSGAGKSSLINAKLIDALEKEQNFFVLPVGRVSGQDTHTSEGLKVDNVFIYSLLHDINDKTTEGDKPAITPSMTLSEYLRLYSGQEPPEKNNSTVPVEALPQILIIDQFEELFTTYPVEWKKRENFFLQLRQAMEDDPKLWVLLSLREDFVAAIDPFAYLFPGRLRARFYMQRLNEFAAGQAISLPAKIAGRVFTDEAVKELVRRLRQLPGDTPSGEQLDQFVEPLVLQLVCYNLWESLADKPAAQTISLADLEIAGDVDLALTNYYNELVLARVLSEDQPGAEPSLSEMALRLWIETRLITPEGRRSFVYEEKGAASILPLRAVHLLYEKRLLTQGRREERIWYELAHDRLVHPIRAANDIWWQEQGVLARAARAWLISGRAESALMLDPAIEQAIELADEKAQDPLVVEFLVQARRKFKRDLSTTGWGVIFANNANPAVRDALVELLDHRRALATRHWSHYYREFVYRPGEQVHEFLSRYGAYDGQPDSEKVPYYLLIVGDPETIPFAFQYQLDVNYAVGRIHFDQLLDYTNYARSVVAAEKGMLKLPRRAVFFDVVNSDYKPTQISNENLTKPLVRKFQADRSNWEIKTHLGEGSTKAQLVNLLGRDSAPALLFTSSSTKTFEKDDPFQLGHQGAIICQDWPGPNIWRGAINSDLYFSGDDLPDEARLLGMVAFLWGDNTAGTPRTDEFFFGPIVDTPKQLASQAFLASLPKRLLSHPNGGALAVIGHVGVAWAYSFLGLSYRGQTGQGGAHAFINAMARLFEGHPVGYAMDFFSRRYLEFASFWVNLQLQQFGGEFEDDFELSRVKSAMVDARNYIVIGDPAVRLMVAEEGEEPIRERPILGGLENGT